MVAGETMSVSDIWHIFAGICGLVLSAVAGLVYQRLGRLEDLGEKNAERISTLEGRLDGRSV